MSPLHSHREPRAQFVSTHCINIFSKPFFVSLSLKEITIFEEKGVRRIYWTRVRSFCLPRSLSDQLSLIDVTLAFEDVCYFDVATTFFFLAILWVRDIVWWQLRVRLLFLFGQFELLWRKHLIPGSVSLVPWAMFASFVAMVMFIQKH